MRVQVSKKALSFPFFFFDFFKVVEAKILVVLRCDWSRANRLIYGTQIFRSP